MSEDKRILSRRDFSIYMRVFDELTSKVVGTLVDISTGGFKLESKHQVPLNVNIRLRIEHTDEISSKPYVVFTAKAKWCRPDPIDPTTYNVGFQIVEMAPSDADIFLQMFNSYGSKTNKQGRGNTDYFWT
jgi:hypothetical protein